MNRKGFTLIELLAVMVILAAILLIGLPALSTSLNKQDEKDLEHRKEIILSQVELYGDRTKECYKIEYLKDANIITDEQSKDKNGNSIEGCVKKDANGEYKFYGECSSC